jgi:hypothetical protein
VNVHDRRAEEPAARDDLERMLAVAQADRVVYEPAGPRRRPHVAAVEPPGEVGAIRVGGEGEAGKLRCAENGAVLRPVRAERRRGDLAHERERSED